LVVCPTNAAIENHINELQHLLEKSKSDFKTMALGTMGKRQFESEAEILTTLSTRTSKIRWGKQQ
jgi:hypothetical protein